MKPWKWLIFLIPIVDIIASNIYREFDPEIGNKVYFVGKGVVNASMYLVIALLSKRVYRNHRGFNLLLRVVVVFSCIFLLREILYVITGWDALDPTTSTLFMRIMLYSFVAIVAFVYVKKGIQWRTP